MPKTFLRAVATALLCLSMPTIAARAQSAADFYRNKQITMMVGSDAGSGYDLYARLLTRYLPRHIPGTPNVIVQNMPNAGSITMTNTVAMTMAKDGTVIGAPQSSVAVEKLLWLLSPGGKTANFDAARLNWLGTMAQDVFVMIGWHTAKAKTMDDLLKQEFIVGVSGPNTDGSLIAAAMNKLLGTKVKLVLGYGGASAELLAMERGEVDGAPMAYSSALTLRPNLLTDGNMNILLQMGARPHPDLAKVPFFEDLVKTDEERAMLSLIFSKYQMGRPFFVPPEVPADRVALLRAAFDATMSDPDLIAEAKLQKLEISPLSGAEVQALVERLYAAPDELVHKARQLLGTEK